MRIVGGRWRGRRLCAPKTDAIRPTTDRARETLFNILAHDPDVTLEGARVLDLFAGTGALGFEALSRGAASCTFIERDDAARRLVTATAEALVADGVRILKRDATKLGECAALGLGPHDLVLLDPPYRQALGERALRSACEGGWIAPGARIVWEEAAASEAQWPDGFRGTDERRVGYTVFRFGVSS